MLKKVNIGPEHKDFIKNGYNHTQVQVYNECDVLQAHFMGQFAKLRANEFIRLRELDWESLKEDSPQHDMENESFRSFEIRLACNKAFNSAIDNVRKALLCS